MIGDMQHLLGEDQAGTHGVTMRIPLGTRAIAKKLGVDRIMVRNWVDGTEPKHAQGEMLILRWCQLTGKSRVFVPMARPVFSSRA